MVPRDLREGLSRRLWLAFVVCAFCVPLFVGLGRTDLGNDEAIYSYAVDSILDTGDWLSPRSSPNEQIVFLEKPPLKFWIVAAPIRFGLLPRDEFGFRFWDPVFGSIAFVYVFLIGRRLAGPVCGAAAVLVLFAHAPLLFEHGLRSNNMDAALFLSYCGGIYHYLAWTDGGSGRRRAAHQAAFGALFFLGFMTKFVAALFLPLVVGLAALIVPAGRRRLRRDWWRWALTAVVVLAAILPWFVYQYTQNGRQIWLIMFGEHVYTRFTAFADPGHVHPWYFYVTEGWHELSSAYSAWWVAFGLAVLLVNTVRHRLRDGVVLMLWLVVPVALISVGTSKLYHYFYPYLPPLALAAGYGIAWLVTLGGGAIAPWLARVGAPWMRPVPPAARRVLWVVMGVALLVALATVIAGPLRFQAGGHTLFRNSSIVRPVLVALACAAIAGRVLVAAGAAVVLLITALVPTPVTAYSDNLGRLATRHHPLRQLAECLREVDASRRAAGHDAPGVYAPVAPEAYLHPYFFYLRGRGWHAGRVDDELLYRSLFVPGEERPVAIDRKRYLDFLERTPTANGSTVAIDQPTILVLLPGPYGLCRATQAYDRQ